MNVKRERIQIVIAGLIIGVIASLLVFFGNPSNMGFCIACFLRDTAGGLGLHRAAAVQYIRPEIIGLVLGSFGVALVKKEFSAKGGSAPVTRFVLPDVPGLPLPHDPASGRRRPERPAGSAGLCAGYSGRCVLPEAGLFPEAHLYPDPAGRRDLPRHSGGGVYPAGSGSRLHLFHRSGRRPRRQACRCCHQPDRRSDRGRSGPAYPPVHGGRHP